MSSKEKQELPPDAAAVAAKQNDKHESDDDSSDDDDDDDDLVLEGVIVRNPDVSDSDDTSSEEEEEEDDEQQDTKPPPSKKNKSEGGADKALGKPSKNGDSKPKRAKKRKNKEAGPEIVQVEFTFCDMNEKFFHGLKTLLTAASPIFMPHSSALADLMIENASVGTVVSTEGDDEGTVFGFASVLNVKTHQEQPSIQGLKKACLDQCPEAHKKELQVVLSGQTKRPAGFYLHGRMVNMPLEIVQVLHEQLVLDMDWAVKNADGGEEMRKSLDFGAFVVLAPIYKASGVSYHKLFDDEIFANHAEFTYEMELPKSNGMEETPYCTVAVMTKTGHRDAMKSIVEMVGGGGAGRR